MLDQDLRENVHNMIFLFIINFRKLGKNNARYIINNIKE